MTKRTKSLIWGIALGLGISYFILDYNGWTIVHFDADGQIERQIRELDYNFLFDSLLIMLLCWGFVFVTLHAKSILKKYKR